MKIRLDLGGRTYEATYDQLTGVTIGESRTIKRETGLTLPELHARLLALKDATPADDNMDLYAALVYLLMRRADPATTWADAENVRLVDLAGLTVVSDEPVSNGQIQP